MNLIQRFASRFRNLPKMSSVSIYRHASGIFVVTQHGSGGGEPCIVAGPLEQLPIDVAHEELGAAIFRGLSRTTHDYPYPKNQEEWKQVTAPLLAAAKCKSWPAFAKSAKELRVDQLEGKVIVRSAEERAQKLEQPVPAELGSLVAAELA